MRSFQYLQCALAHTAFAADERYSNTSFWVCIVIAIASYVSGGSLLANLGKASFAGSLASAILAFVIGAFLG